MKATISLKTHNILDYVAGLFLLVSPFLFGFSNVENARITFLILGSGLIFYSALTKYYYAVARIIPLGVHMTLDIISGLVLMMAPWIFNYRDLLGGFQLALHFVLGFGVIGLVGLTHPRNEKERMAEKRGEYTPFQKAA